MADFLKQPSEEFTIAVDFSGDLDTGETLDSAVVTATDSAGTDVTSTIVASDAVSGSTWAVRVRAGTAGQDYKITVTATTSDSQVYEHEVTMRVREL